MRLTALAALLASSALLTACGGGAGGSSAMPPVTATQSTAAEPTDFERGLQSGHFAAACNIAAAGEARCFSYVLTDTGRAVLSLRTPEAAAAGTPAGYGPAQLQSAYGTAGVAATGGSGSLVAIVDAYDDPNLENDLAVYRSQYGLPPCTSANGCFKKVNQNGGTSYPSPNSSWGQETSLDVDMVSANCPKCHILVVEANSASFANLATGVNTAARMGAVAISNSYGGNESASQATYASSYSHPGIAITASNGDSGYGAQSPASYGTLTAVGGTSLKTASNARGWSETVWSGSGSGCSAYEVKPAWQHDPNCTKRMIGDVAYIGDPYTGVAVYDSFGSRRNTGWLVFGGTSVGAPAIAAISALSGNTSGVPASFAYGSKALNDVTTGSNGSCPFAYYCNGEVGYDGPTGNGTPSGTSAF